MEPFLVCLFECAFRVKFIRSWWDKGLASSTWFYR